MPILPPPPKKKVALAEIEGATEDVLDRVAAGLRVIGRMAALDAALQIGKLIMDEIFHGDINAWRTQGAKDASFRRLASRPDLNMSPSTLHRAVATYDLVERLGGFASWQHVSAIHVRIVLGLPEEQQIRLLRAAEVEHWPSEKLEEEARKRRYPPGERRGRPPLPEVVKALGKVKRVVDLQNRVFTQPTSLDGLDSETVEALALAVVDIRARFEALHATLEARRAYPRTAPTVPAPKSKRALRAAEVQLPPPARTPR